MKTDISIEDRNADLMVTIRCITYNHAPYIRQCLDGFVMQQTNFRFEAIVHDDASTDGTTAIIREYSEKYPDIIKPIFEIENQYSKRDGSIGRIMNKHMRGKYIAMCEGDDYWIDPLKLQKQVDFLESNEEYGLVRTNINRFFQDKNEMEYNFFSKNKSPKIKNTFEDFLINAWFAAPCTWLYRADFIPYLSILSTKKYRIGDLPLLLIISSMSKIKYIEDITCVYRILNNSASHFKTAEETLSYYDDVFKINFDFSRNCDMNIKMKILFHMFIVRLRVIGHYHKPFLFFRVLVKTINDFIYNNCKK